jgi:histidinol-phosphate/aromatic aminotransferase/cobyric acid decarboxylase-like protein
VSAGRFFRRSIAELVPYEPGKPIEEVQRELGLDRVVKLASNEGPFGPFPAAIEALERQQHELNRYPDGGAYALRTALAERHDVDFEQVTIGLPGSYGMRSAIERRKNRPALTRPVGLLHRSPSCARTSAGRRRQPLRR